MVSMVTSLIGSYSDGCYVIPCVAHRFIETALTKQQSSLLLDTESMKVKECQSSLKK